MILTEFDAGVAGADAASALPRRRDGRPDLARLRRWFENDEPQQDAAARPTNGLAVAVRGLVKSYGARPVLDGVDLHIAPGEFLSIVGRSGCGKSTLLRLIAGLEAPSQGELSLDGEARDAHREDVRIMFQDARLLPWKRVVDNIAIGLPGTAAERRERAREALAQVGLADRADDWPAVLSGGQRQRVALARALVHAPRLLLLDEPLGALDALTRIEMHRLIERLWREHGFTALLVTHDVSEAVALADRIVLIDEGRIAYDERVSLARPRQPGTPGFAEIEGRALRRVLREEEPLAGTAAAAVGAAVAPAAPQHTARVLPLRISA